MPAGINPAVATRKLWLVTHPLLSVPAEPDKPLSWHRVTISIAVSAKLGLDLLAEAERGHFEEGCH